MTRRDDQGGEFDHLEKAILRDEPPFPLLTAYKNIPLRTFNCGMYVLEHVKSGYLYVGSTYSLRTRFIFHAGNLRRNEHYNVKLQELFREDPEINVIMIVLTDSRKEAYDLEQKTLDEYRAKGAKLINMTLDVRASFKGIKKTPEAVERSRQAAIRMWEDPEYKEGMRQLHTGRKRSPETVDNILRSRGVTERRVSINGKVYDHIQAASDALGMTYSAVYFRCRSPLPQYVNWFCL